MMCVRHVYANINIDSSDFLTAKFQVKFIQAEIFTFPFLLVPGVSCYLNSMLCVIQLDQLKKEYFVPMSEKIPTSGLADSKSLYARCLTLLFLCFGFILEAHAPRTIFCAVSLT